MQEKKTTAAERVRAKRKSQRKHKIKNIPKGNWLSKLGVIALAVLILYVLVFSATVNKIDVIGEKNTPSEAIKSALKGVKGGKLFGTSVGKIRSDLLKSGWPETVHIDRQYWSRKLVITITERKPFVNVQLNKGFLVIDDNLSVIEQQKVFALEIPVIQETGIKSAKPGQVLSGEKIKAAADILKKMDPVTLKLITIVSVADLEDIRLWTLDTTVIVYGEAVEIEKKNIAIKELIKKHGSDLITVDVRVPSKPATKSKTDQ